MLREERTKRGKKLSVRERGKGGGAVQVVDESRNE